MFKLTMADLQMKSDTELTGLFNQATRQLAGTPRLSSHFAAASVALRLLRDELNRRGISLG